MLYMSNACSINVNDFYDNKIENNTKQTTKKKHKTMLECDSYNNKQNI